MSRVLVVDDEKLIVKGLKFSLEQDGLTVDSAYDGEEALSLIRENKYDIVLLDLMLPKMNGYEVCRRISEFSDIPIVFLTGKSMEEDKLRGLMLGGDDYIIKPFDTKEMIARIKAVLRRYKQPAPKPAEPAAPAGYPGDRRAGSAKRFPRAVSDERESIYLSDLEREAWKRAEEEYVLAYPCTAGRSAGKAGPGNSVRETRLCGVPGGRRNREDDDPDDPAGRTFR